MHGATPRNVPPVGTQGNAFNAQAAGAGVASNIIEVWSCPYVSCFGHVSGATTLTMQYSIDKINFYNGPTVAPTGAADFYLDFYTAARWVRVLTSGAVTITATIAAK